MTCLPDSLPASLPDSLPDSLRDSLQMSWPASGQQSAGEASAPQHLVGTSRIIQDSRIRSFQDHPPRGTGDMELMLSSEASESPSSVRCSLSSEASESPSSVCCSRSPSVPDEDDTSSLA